jgi:hypothetical protein
MNSFLLRQFFVFYRALSPRWESIHGSPSATLRQSSIWAIVAAESDPKTRRTSSHGRSVAASTAPRRQARGPGYACLHFGLLCPECHPVLNRALSHGRPGTGLPMPSIRVSIK